MSWWWVLLLRDLSTGLVSEFLTVLQNRSPRLFEIMWSYLQCVIFISGPAEVSFQQQINTLILPWTGLLRHIAKKMVSWQQRDRNPKELGPLPLDAINKIQNQNRTFLPNGRNRGSHESKAGIRVRIKLVRLFCSWPCRRKCRDREKQIFRRRYRTDLGQSTLGWFWAPLMSGIHHCVLDLQSFCVWVRLMGVGLRSGTTFIHLENNVLHCETVCWNPWRDTMCLFAQFCLDATGCFVPFMKALCSGVTIQLLDIFLLVDGKTIPSSTTGCCVANSSVCHRTFCAS